MHASCAYTQVITHWRQRFDRKFNQPNRAGFAPESLFTLRQGSHSVANYAVEFGILVAEAGWDELTLLPRFVEQHVPHLIAEAQPADLDGLVDCTIEIDNYQRDVSGIGSVSSTP